MRDCVTGTRTAVGRSTGTVCVIVVRKARCLGSSVKGRIRWNPSVEGRTGAGRSAAGRLEMLLEQSVGVSHHPAPVPSSAR